MKNWCALVLLTSMQLSAVTAPKRNVYVTAWDNVLPQVADGGGWSSRITLVNLDSVAASFNLYFYQSDGSAWNITFQDSPGAQSLQPCVQSDLTTQIPGCLSGTIPVGGSLFLETPNTATDTVSGWAYLSSGQWVSGVGAFLAHWLVTNDAEAVVPFASEHDGYYSPIFMPFDNRNGFVTSIAIVNPSETSSSTVTLTFRNPDGSSVTQDVFTLAPLEHRAFSTIEQYGDAVISKYGSMQFTVTGNGVSVLGLLFTPFKSFTSTHSLSIIPA